MTELDVLIIDDDTWQQASYVRILSRNGAYVRTASNPHDALDAIEEKLPDVIVLDLMLEGNTAFALLHELQSDDELSAVPVVVCTNLADRVDNVTMLQYGVKRVLDKARMRPGDIIAAIKMVTV